MLAHKWLCKQTIPSLTCYRDAIGQKHVYVLLIAFKMLLTKDPNNYYWNIAILWSSGCLMMHVKQPWLLR